MVVVAAGCRQTAKCPPHWHLIDCAQGDFVLDAMQMYTWKQWLLDLYAHVRFQLVSGASGPEVRLQL